MQEFYDYTFQQYEMDVKKLVASLDESVIGNENVHLFGIYRGGLPLATHVSHLIKRPLNIIKHQTLDGFDEGMEVIVNPEDYGDDPAILILDDIYDTGKTMRNIFDMFNQEFHESQIHMATLFGTENELGVRYARNYPGMWVRFPWER